MSRRGSKPVSFEPLEGRLLMTTSKPIPALPYSILTITGGFETGVPVTVTFQSRHHGSITVPASMASGNAVTVAVPFFLDSKKGTPVAETAKVTAIQGPRKVSTITGFAVASLPETGLPAGSLLAETALELHGVIGDVVKSLATEIQPAAPLIPSPAETTTLQLLAIDQGLINLEVGIAPLLTGTVKSVKLGTFHGKPAVIDAKALSLIDRGIAAVVDDPTGMAATSPNLTGPALAVGLLDVINGALAGGRPTILGAAGRLVNVLSTGPGTQGFPVGPLVTGLALGDTVALVAVAEAEVGSSSGRNTLVTLANASLDYIQGNLFFQAAGQFLADPILPMATAAIEAGFKPASTPAGRAILGMAYVDDSLARELAIGVGTLGAQLQQELSDFVL